MSERYNSNMAVGMSRYDREVKKMIRFLAIIAVLIAASPVRGATPSVWVGVSSTENDGVDGPTPGVTAQVEQHISDWELTASAGWANREKIETGDGYSVQAGASVKRWFGRIAPGLGVTTSRQVTSRWEKDETKALALLSIRFGRAELTPEYRWPLSSEDDGGGVTSYGVSVEVPVTGRWWIRGGVLEADFGDGTDGSSVSAAVGWRGR